MMNDLYRMTENGSVAKYQQGCGCNAYGAKCKEGKALYRAMNKDQKTYEQGKMTMRESDVTLNAWLTHIGC